MQNTEKTDYRSDNPVCDALRFLDDACYAILPRDVAHRLGELQKNFWGGVRWLAEKKIDWINARVAGGDRLRAEWQRRPSAENKTYDAPSGGI